MVEVPADLAQALEADEEATARFDALPEQDQAHLVELVLKARDEDHRRNRILWIVGSLSTPFLLMAAAAFVTGAL